MLYTLLILSLLFSSLPPEAAQHSARGVERYEAGDLDAAIEAFAAAYAALPDARVDREGREEMLGSLHGLLLEVHTKTGGVEPLCRLQTLLREHLAALQTAHADEAELREVGVNRERLQKVDLQLAGLSGDACRPAEPGPAVGEPVPREPVAGSPGAPGPTTLTSVEAPPAAGSGAVAVDASAHDAATGAGEPIPPRHLRIAGGVTLGLGMTALGVMVAGIVREGQVDGPLDALEVESAYRPFTTQELKDLHDMRDEARRGRTLAITGGVAAAVFVALGVGLLVAGKRAARRERWSAAPWGSPTGAGLVMTVPVGARGRNHR